MPLMSARASGVMINRRLGADMRRRLVSTLIGFVDLPLHLFPEFVGQFNSVPALESRAHQLSQLEELRFLLVHQGLQRSLDHGGGIWVLAPVDPVLDLLFGLRSQGHAHRIVLLHLSLANPPGFG